MRRALPLRLLLALTTASTSLAQTVPPPPVVQPVQSPAILQVTVKGTAAQCYYGGTACGLSDCGCWWQLYRAQCSSATSCPAVTTGPPFTSNLPSVSTTSTQDPNLGTNFQFIDSDAALSTGTVWIYFLTVNFANYVPFTPSAPSNSTGPVQIPVSTGPPRVRLDFDNQECFPGQNCSMRAYRAQCPTPQTCPAWPNSTFAILPDKDAAGNSYSTQTVTATNTHFTYHDVGPLSYKTSYEYAVTNMFLAYPSNESQPAFTIINTPYGAHQAVINYSSAACRTTSPCDLHVYRSQCSSSSSCPSFPGSAWKVLNMATTASTVGAQSTTWTYTDSDNALTSGTTYQWIATSSYIGGSTESAPSTPFTGTTATSRGKKNEKHRRTSSHDKRHAGSVSATVY